MKNIIRICALIVIVSFFCPFFMVSCQGLEEDISGFNLAQGTDYSDGNIIVLAIVVIAVAVFVVASVESLNPFSKMVNIGGSAVGLMLLVYTYNSVMGEAQKQGVSRYIEVRYGFWGCVLGYAAILGLTLYTQHIESKALSNVNSDIYDE